jgi:hypothetical protein
VRLREQADTCEALKPAYEFWGIFDMLYISSSRGEVIRKLLDLVPLKIDDAVRLCLDAQAKIRSQ